jgi:PAS domain S-box-containing protein
VNPTRDSQLQRTLADLQRLLADTQCELAERTVERDEALEHQTATSEVLNVISRSTFELNPVLDTLLEMGAHLCRAEQTVITLRHSQDGLYHYGTSFGYGAAFKELLICNPVAPGRTSLIGRTALEGQIVHIEDAAADPDYKWAEALRLGRWHTGLGVPLLRDGSVIGILALTRRRVERFTDKQIELTKTFANQAVIAIENARLLVELRESEERHGLVNQAVAEGIYEWDIERNSLWVSSRLTQIFGFEGRKLTAADWNELVHPEDFARYRTALRDCFKAVTARLDCDYRVRHSDGQYRWVEDRGVPVRDTVGRAVRLVGAVSDISERKAADQALQESLEYQTAVGEVLKVISRSAVDLDAVLDTVVTSAVTLCRAEYAVIYRRQGGEFHWVASHGLMPEYDRIERDTPIRPGSGTLIGRVALDGRTIVIPDAWSDPLYEAKDAARIGNVRSMLGVPLVREGAVIGAIGLARGSTEPYSEREILLVTTFADQAVIAIENTRLITETREALDQQTATAEVLGVINASPGDLAPVFDAMLEKAMRLCQATFGHVWSFDGEQLYAVAAHGDPVFVRWLQQHSPVRPIPGSAADRIAQGEDFVHVTDRREETAYGSDPTFRALVDTSGIRASLSVALRRGRDKALLGMVNVYRQEVRPFSDKQIALLQNFAAQAVIAMENARLITETREALEQQTATAEVLGVINSHPGDLAPVFDAMLEKALDLCEAVFGVLWTYDGARLHMAASRGDLALPEELVREGIPTGPENGDAPGRLLRGEPIVHIADIVADMGYQFASQLRRILLDSGGRTLLAVPLWKDSVFLGYFAIYRREVRPFTDKQIALLQNFAAQAVIAMENARLLGDLRERTGDLQQSLEYQTATSEVLQVISRSTFDLQPVLDTLVETAARLCAADGAGLTIREREAYRYVSVSDLSTDFFAYLQQRTFVPGRETMAGRVALEARTVHIADITADPDYRLPEAFSLGGIRTMLGVPMLRDGAVVGTFSLVRRRVEPFTDRQIELVQTFADQAVIAIENARLLTETSEARDEAQTALRGLKAAQANLIQAEKMASLGQLTAGIAHEIKNPLNFVNNFASLSNELLEELKEETEPALATLDADKRAGIDETLVILSGNLEKIVEHGKRADNIVKSMLEHSRGVTGERREVDLNGVVEEALKLAYHGARAQDQSFNITLKRDYAEGLKPIKLAPQEITRVFLNLFGNGFYAANKRARDNGDGSFRAVLTVRTCEDGDAVEIRVRDNGTGIPSELKDKLFQPFFTTKPTGEGTGLGLSISYDIVTQQHGGTITVESEPGAYTEFIIRLPRH